MVRFDPPSPYWSTGPINTAQVTCEECAQELLDRGDRCPMCREAIAGIVPGDFARSYVGRSRLATFT